VGCVPVAEVEGDSFAVGPWCWLLARARRIWPVPFKGPVSLFDVPLQYGLSHLYIGRRKGAPGVGKVSVAARRRTLLTTGTVGSASPKAGAGHARRRFLRQVRWPGLERLCMKWPWCGK
jgi:hypothetical protein